MGAIARTPEELETMLEDAILVRDREAVAGLFEDAAVMIAGKRADETRGSMAIARLAEEMWQSDYVYLADPRRVLQVRDTALVLASGGISVVRRGPEGGWRYAISLLGSDDHNTEEVSQR